MITFEVREALDCLLRVAVLPRLLGPVTEGLSYNHLTCANGSVRRKQESRLVKINATLVKCVPCALRS